MDTTQSNVQDVFLNYARREHLTVLVRLLDGREMTARIKGFDRFALLVDDGAGESIVFKHAIATIGPGTSGASNG